jgi:hypothetical protein
VDEAQKRRVCLQLRSLSAGAIAAALHTDKAPAAVRCLTEALLDPLHVAQSLLAFSPDNFTNGGFTDADINKAEAQASAAFWHAHAVKHGVLLALATVAFAASAGWHVRQAHKQVSHGMAQAQQRATGAQEADRPECAHAQRGQVRPDSQVADSAEASHAGTPKRVSELAPRQSGSGVLSAGASAKGTHASACARVPAGQADAAQERSPGTTLQAIAARALKAPMAPPLPLCAPTTAEAPQSPLQPSSPPDLAAQLLQIASPAPSGRNSPSKSFATDPERLLAWPLFSASPPPQAGLQPAASLESLPSLSRWASLSVSVSLSLGGLGRAAGPVDASELRYGECSPGQRRARCSDSGITGGSRRNSEVGGSQRASDMERVSSPAARRSESCRQSGSRRRSESCAGSEASGGQAQGAAAAAEAWDVVIGGEQWLQEAPQRGALGPVSWLANSASPGVNRQHRHTEGSIEVPTALAEALLQIASAGCGKGATDGQSAEVVQMQAQATHAAARTLALCNSALPPTQC